MILPLAIPYWATGLLVGAFLLVCVILMLVVLIQRPQGGGLSGAFGAGGGGAGQTAFGTKTGDALTYATIGMFILYLAFAVGLNFATRPENITGGTMPTVQSTNPVETTDSDPIEPINPAGANTPEDGSPEAQVPEDGSAATEQAAEEILNDAEQATPPATDAGTEPAGEAPAGDAAGENTPPTL